MIENQPNRKQYSGIGFKGEVLGVKTKKVYFGTKMMYDVVITTDDPNVLALGALKATSEVSVEVEVINEPEKANAEKEFK